MLGNDCPEYKYLNKFVREEVCAACVNSHGKWQDLGIVLMGQKSASKLDIIQVKYKEDVMQCCSAMFKLWRQTQSEANWNQLIRALKEVELNALAAKIEKLLLPSVKQQHTGDQLQTKRHMAVEQVLEDEQSGEGMYVYL